MKTKKESSGAWIFQTSPKWFRFIDKLRFGNNRDTWRVMRFRKEVKTGDIVFFWMAGPAAGIYAIGEVLSYPQVMMADKETALYSTPEYKEAFPVVNKPCIRVWCRYNKKIIDRPVLRDKIKDSPILKSLSIIRQPQGTNFRVTKEQFEELKELVCS